jgi:hypothetical protein
MVLVAHDRTPDAALGGVIVERDVRGDNEAGEAPPVAQGVASGLPD